MNNKTFSRLMLALQFDLTRDTRELTEAAVINFKKNFSNLNALIEEWQTNESLHN